MNLPARSVLALLVFALVPTEAQRQSQAADRPQPLAVAHRGLLLHAPENTLAGFRACLDLRFGFEFDVQRTKDGELVCIHDDMVTRTTNGTGAVAELTLAEIRKLDAGRWFDRRFAGEKVPTIDEVLGLLAEYRHHEILVAVDLKGEDVAVDVVKLAEKHKVLHRLLFIGRTITEARVREQIKSTSTAARTAAVANNSSEFSGALISPNADWIYFRFIPSQEQVAAVHRARKHAFIAGPGVGGHQPDNWQQAAHVGIDGILTDYPLELQATFAKTSRPRDWSQLGSLPAPEANQAAAADEDFVYAITNTQVARYDRKSRKRLAVSTGEAQHLNSGFLWKGSLYCAHSNYPHTPEQSEIKLLDLESMQLSTFKSFGNYGGSLTWAVRHNDDWWCNFARYGDNNSGTFLAKFDAEWQEQGRWTYPPAVIHKLGKFSLSGGIWHDGNLLVTGHDDQILFRLRLPMSGTVLDLVDTEAVPFTGQGFATDPQTGGLVGINRAKKEVVFAIQN